MPRTLARGLLVGVVAMLSIAVASPTVAAPKPPKNSKKKANSPETKVTRTPPTDAQKAGVEKWLAGHLDDPRYEVVQWGDVVNTEIDKTTRTAIELKYRAVNRFGALELHDSFFLLDDNGNVFGEQGPAAFGWQNAMTHEAQRYRESAKKQKSKKAEAAKPKKKPTKKNPPPPQPVPTPVPTVAEVEAYLQDNLDDPDGLQIVVSGKAYHTLYMGSAHIIHYRAKNELGALELHQSVFFFGPDGKQIIEQGAAAFLMQNDLIVESKKHKATQNQKSKSKTKKP